MIKADENFISLIQEIKNNGFDSVEPRTKWSGGTPAHYKYTLPKCFTYDISKGEFPIITLRPTAIKGGYHDIEAIYQKQTNIIEDMDKSIHSWWRDFIVNKTYGDKLYCEIHDIGKTYGDTIFRYDLMNNLLNNLKKDPFGRRNMIDMWQYQQMIDDPKALVPCCFLSMYSVTKSGSINDEGKEIRYLHLSLIQRSMDVMMTFSINPTQYTLLGMMICSELNNHYGKDCNFKYEMGTLTHFIQNPHIYDRHLKFVDEILERTPKNNQAIVKLKNDYKEFYDITWDDFEVIGYEKPKPLSGKLEIAI